MTIAAKRACEQMDELLGTIPETVAFHLHMPLRGGLGVQDKKAH